MSEYELTKKQFEELSARMNSGHSLHGKVFPDYRYRGGSGYRCLAISQSNTRSGVASLILATSLLGFDPEDDRISVSKLLDQVSELERMARHDNFGMGFIVYYPLIRVDSDERLGRVDSDE